MAKNILIVDDDVELCEELAELLRDEGFIVKTIFNGSDGKKEIESSGYDLLILDFKMPGLNGIEVLKEVKEKKPSCKFIVVSGKPHLEKTLEQEGLSAFVSGIMQKPFDVETLLKKINTCLSTKP